MSQTPFISLKFYYLQIPDKTYDIKGINNCCCCTAILITSIVQFSCSENTTKVHSSPGLMHLLSLLKFLQQIFFSNSRFKIVVLFFDTLLQSFFSPHLLSSFISSFKNHQSMKSVLYKSDMPIKTFLYTLCYKLFPLIARNSKT